MESADLSPRRRWAHVGVAVLGGVLQSLAQGFSYWPLAFVCFLPMFWLQEAEPKARTQRILALGLVHGTVCFTGGYYWLVAMLENFSGYEGLPNWGFASVFFVYQGVQQMLLYWLYARARRRGAPVALAAVGSLMAVEWLFPALFPSFLATSLHNLPIFLQVVDLGGPMLLSAVMMAANAALFEAYRVRHGAPQARRTWGVAAFGLVFTLAYGAYRVAEVDARAADAETVHVGMVQVNMGIFEKREDPFEGHRRHLQQSRQLLARGDLDLLVWPESAYTYFLREGTPDVRRTVLSSPDFPEPLEAPTLFGGLSRRRVQGEGRSYNTAFLTNARGEIVGTYDKTYLLAFGEYLPLGDVFPILYEWSPNTGRFTPGDHVRALAHGSMRITTLVCYEDVLPAFTRRAVAENTPNLLANITNDAWFGDTREPWIHLALAKFRAVEHHRALVRATNSGVSAFVDPVGRTLDTIAVGERDQLVAELPLLDENTVYTSLGDWPAYLGAPLIAFLAFRRRRDA
ncbi:MAG: apolipoprotein N-acyltransferase [Myxococcota bacterium]